MDDGNFKHIASSKGGLLMRRTPANRFCRSAFRHGIGNKSIAGITVDSGAGEAELGASSSVEADL